MLIRIATLSWGQVITFDPNASGSPGIEYMVNIPSTTASSDSGPIYFSMSCPAGTQWCGFGQGTQMVGADIFVLYAASSTNVTVSPRLGKGEFQPLFNPAAQITVLDGSGVSSDGVLTAHVRCDTCLSWSGGSMDPTDSSSDWIWSVKRGSPINSEDPSATIIQHDIMGTTNLDLTKAQGGSSSNPFANSTSNSSSTTSSSGSAPSSSGGTVFLFLFSLFLAIA